MSQNIEDAFQLLEMRFEDGYGSVWSAQDTASRKHYDIRKFNVQLSKDKDFIDALSASCQPWQMLEQSGVQNLHEVRVVGGEVFLLMEAVTGHRLSAIDLSALSQSKRGNYSFQLLKTIQEAHDNGVIHQDIQPTKLLITENDDLLITDFGLSKALSIAKATKVGLIQAKFDYVSPEVMKGDPFTTLSDIYSVALVVWELLEGTQACPKGPLPSQFQWHMMGGFSKLSPQKTTADVFESLKSMAKTTPSQRPQHLSNIIQAWPELMKGLSEFEGPKSEQSNPIRLEKSDDIPAQKTKTPIPPKPRARAGLRIGRSRSPKPTPEAPPPSAQPMESAKAVDIFTGPRPKHIRLEGSILGTNTVLDLCMGPIVSFGRDSNKCDVPILIEPISPKHLYATNISQSMRISSRHFQVEVKSTQVILTDLGSANGTMINGQRIAANTPKVIEEHDIIFITESLAIRPTIHRDKNNAIQFVVFHRLNNTQEKKHIVIRNNLFVSSTGLNADPVQSGFQVQCLMDAVHLRMHNEAGLFTSAQLGQKELPLGTHAQLGTQPYMGILQMNGILLNWSNIK